MYDTYKAQACSGIWPNKIYQYFGDLIYLITEYMLWKYLHSSASDTVIVRWNCLT